MMDTTRCASALVRTHVTPSLELVEAARVPEDGTQEVPEKGDGAPRVRQTEQRGRRDAAPARARDPAEIDTATSIVCSGRARGCAHAERRSHV